MDTKTKVSVIVPVYNAKDYLLQTAEYIKNQTLKEIEIIYVDDGSTDGSRDLLEKIKEEDERVQILYQQNSYAGVARNNGLEKATGKYVVFWDADDIFLPEALEEMYLKCEEDNADLCVCGASHYDEKSERTLMISTYLKKDKIPEYTPFGHEDIDEYLFNFSTNVPWNKMFNRQFIIDKGIRYQAVKQANDNYFVMLAFFYAKTFTVVDKELIIYRINYGSSLTGRASDTPLCVYKAYSETYEHIKKQPGFEKVEQSFLNKTLRSFFYFLSKQTTLEAYETLYNHYKEEVFPKWGFPENEDFYYVAKDYDRFQRVKSMDAMTFVHSEYRNTFDELRILKDVKATQKEKIATLKQKSLAKIEKIEKLKEKNENLKAANARLKEKNQKLQDRITELKESFSYKVGCAFTYIPRKIKKSFKNGEKEK